MTRWVAVFGWLVWVWAFGFAGGVARAQDADDAADEEAAEGEGAGDEADDAEGGGEADEAEEEATEYPKPEKVYIGAYINDIQTVDLKEHGYAVDAYIWFRWADPELSPADSMEFLNPQELWGHMEELGYEEPDELDDGQFYQVLRIQGRFSKKLPLYNYPFDRQVLTVMFEDAGAEFADLQYVAEEITLNPRMTLPGYELGTPRILIEDIEYPTQFGDPRLDSPSHYSRATLEIPISRPVVAYASKLLLPVLCVVACAALMFLLAPSYVDSRVGVGITSLLTIVALQMTFNQDLPDVGYLMLMDKVYLCSYLYVIAGLAVSVQSTRLFDAGELEPAAYLHRRGLAVLTTAYLIAVVVLVTLALSQG